MDDSVDTLQRKGHGKHFNADSGGQLCEDKFASAAIHCLYELCSSHRPDPKAKDTHDAYLELNHSK